MRQCVVDGCSGTLRRKNRSGRCPVCIQKARDASSAARLCRACPKQLARKRKSGLCATCLSHDRSSRAEATSAVAAAASALTIGWKRFLLGWARLSEAMRLAARAEILLRKYQLLVRDRSNHRWRLGDVDTHHVGTVEWFPRDAILYLAKIRKIAVVFTARGICRFLDSNPTSAS